MVCPEFTFRRLPGFLRNRQEGIRPRERCSAGPVFQRSDLYDHLAAVCHSVAGGNEFDSDRVAEGGLVVLDTARAHVRESDRCGVILDFCIFCAEASAHVDCSADSRQ